MPYANNTNNNTQEVTAMETIKSTTTTQEVNTMEAIKSTNTTQEVNTMKNEKHCVKVESLVRGISTVLFFEDASEARGFADELDVTLLQNSCLFEVSMVWGADAYTLVQMPEDESERGHLTIIDHDFGTVVEMTVSSYGANYYIAEALNAVFTGTSFEAYAGYYETYCLEKKRNEEAKQSTSIDVPTAISYDYMCDLRCKLIREGYGFTGSALRAIELTAPKVYEALPDVSYTFYEINFITEHLCYDAPHSRAMYDATSTNGVLYRTDKGTFAFRPLTDEEAEMSLRKLTDYLK